MIGEERRKENKEKEDQKIKDTHTKIITYLSGQITKRIPLKTLLDTSEMLYYDEEKTVYRFDGECVIDVEMKRQRAFDSEHCLTLLILFYVIFSCKDLENFKACT